jgi:flagellar hook assembly protein FlgD
MNIRAVDAATTASRATEKLTGFGADTFITLLMAQLRAQNPFDPLKPEEMVGQLTQISTLQELVRIRQAVEAGSGGAAATRQALAPAKSN